MTDKKKSGLGDKFFKSEFNRNVLTLMTGTTIAQAIPIAITPILTRIYSPEDFGVYALFLSVVSIFGTMVNGRYELAIVIPKNDEDAINILALSFFLNLIISILLLGSTFLFYDFFTNLSGATEIGIWLYFAPLVIFLIGFWNTLNYFNIRKKNFQDIATATIIKTIVLATTQLCLGILKSGVTGLISGQILSQLSANTKLLVNIIKDQSLTSKISKVNILNLAKKYKKFPKYNAPAALADTAALQLPSVLLPKLFGLATSGYFFLAHRMIAIPSAMIGKSISEVFFQEISKKNNMNIKCWPFFIKTVRTLFLIGAPISLFIALVVPHLFQFVFGEEWKLSGEIARYLAIVFLFTFVVSTVSCVFSVSGHLKRGASWRYFYFTTSLSMFLFAAAVGLKFFEFLLLFLIHEISLYSIYLYLIVKTVRDLDVEIYERTN